MFPAPYFLKEPCVKLKTYSVLRFTINKLMLFISTAFTVLLFLLLSDALVGKAAFCGLAVGMEVAKYILAALYKRDKQRRVLVMYGVAFVFSFVSTSAFALEEITGRGEAIENVDRMFDSKREKIKKLDEKIESLQKRIDSEYDDILAYEGDAINQDGTVNATGREWQKKYYREQRLPTITGWEQSMALLIEEKNDLESEVESKTVAEFQETTQDPDRAFRLLGFGVVPPNIIKLIMMVALAVWLELFIFMTTEPLGGGIGASSVAIATENPPPSREVSENVSVKVGDTKLGIGEFVDRCWELQKVFVRLTDEKLADEFGVEVEDIRKVRVKLQMMNWKEGPVATYHTKNGLKLNYKPDVIRQIKSKLEE